MDNININIEKTSVDIESGLEKAIDLLSYTGTSPIGLSSILECDGNGKIVGHIPTVPLVNPTMNGTMFFGTWQNGLARADHVHPSDTSKSNAVDGVHTGETKITQIRQQGGTPDNTNDFRVGKNGGDAIGSTMQGLVDGHANFIFNNVAGITKVKTPTEGTHASTKAYADTKANAVDGVHTGETKIAQIRQQGTVADNTNDFRVGKNGEASPGSTMQGSVNCASNFTFDNLLGVTRVKTIPNNTAPTDTLATNQAWVNTYFALSANPVFTGTVTSDGLHVGSFNVNKSGTDTLVSGDMKDVAASSFIMDITNDPSSRIKVNNPTNSDDVANKDYVDTADGLKANAANPVFTGTLTSPKVMLTSEGGIAVKMTNKSGSTIAKGRIVEPYSATGGFRLAQLEAWNPIGITYDATIANDADGWVVVSGIADVYYSVSSTIGNVARVGMTADTGEVAGEAISDAAPTNDAIHFREIGHPIQTRVGAGLALTILHFN